MARSSFKPAANAVVRPLPGFSDRRVSAHRSFPVFLLACTLFIPIIGCRNSADAGTSGAPPAQDPGGGTTTYTLNVSVSGAGTVTGSAGGIDCGTACSANIDAGSTVLLTAASASGSTFTGWSGDCSGTGNCTLTMSANRSTIATFTHDGGVVGAFEGYGAGVTGGAGQPVVMVTNLNNSGAGSLRGALGSNRIIQFGVSGTILLSSDLTVNGTNVTLDGFSAPSPGITLSGGQLVISGNPAGADAAGSNIIVQGLRFRNPGSANDGIQIAYNAHDIVIDHVTVSGSGDGAIDVTEGAYNVTISNSILDYSNSADGPGASLLAFNASRVSYHHNIFHGARDRNPILTCSYTQVYSTGAPHTDILADVRYNVVWNYGIGTYVMSSGTCVGAANVVANLYRNNGSTNASNVIIRSNYAGATARADAYIAGNVVVHDPRGCAYPYNAGSCFDFQTTNSQNNHAEYSAPAIAGPSVTDQQGRLDTWQSVKETAGVISKYPDDTADNTVRTAITIPGLSIFSQPWSD